MSTIETSRAKSLNALRKLLIFGDNCSIIRTFPDIRSQGGARMARSRLGALPLLLIVFSIPLTAQIQPIPNLMIQPVPIPGGELLTGYGISNAFAPGPPGQVPPYDPIGTDPNIITNFKGLVAMGYTSGPAVDGNGNQFVVITDIRVYKGAYRGGKALDPANTAGATVSALSGNPDDYNDPDNSIFVEI
jgi:hypothetical protein